MGEGKWENPILQKNGLCKWGIFFEKSIKKDAFQTERLFLMERFGFGLASAHSVVPSVFAPSAVRSGAARAERKFR